MNLVRNALWRALIYLGVTLVISLLPLVLTLFAHEPAEVHLAGAYAVLFDNAITFLPLALIGAVTTDYFFSRTLRLKKEQEGLLIALYPFMLTTVMYWEFFTIRSIRSADDAFIQPLAIIQACVVMLALAYAILLKYLLFASERENV